MRTLFIVCDPFSSLVLFPVFLFFASTITPATNYESWLHLAFISRQFLAALKTQTVCVCVFVLGGVGGWTELGVSALCWHSRCWFGSTVVALFVPPSFFLSTERAEQRRLKGTAEIKETMLSVFHIFWLVQWARPLLSESTQQLSQGLKALFVL